MTYMMRLAWAAGFVEGEGTFAILRAKGRTAGTPMISASQVQREPLDRMSVLLGGTVFGPYENGGNHAPYFRWTLYGHHAIAVIFTLFTFLSPKRRAQILPLITAWKHQPGMGARNRRKTHCPRGHEYDAANTNVYEGRRFCRACQRVRGATYYRNVTIPRRGLAQTQSPARVGTRN